MEEAKASKEQQCIDAEKAVSATETKPNATKKRQLDDDETKIHRNSADAVQDDSDLLNNDTVYVGGLPNRYCSTAIVEKIMAPFGSVVRCTLMSDKNVAFCQFSNPSDARKAVTAVHGRLLGGMRLVVRPAHAKHTSTATAVARVTTAAAARSPKRQKAHLESKIAAIKRKLDQRSKIEGP